MKEPFILPVTWVSRLGRSHSLSGLPVLRTGTMKDSFAGDVIRMVALPQCNAHSPRSLQP